MCRIASLPFWSRFSFWPSRQSERAKTSKRGRWIIVTAIYISAVVDRSKIMNTWRSPGCGASKSIAAPSSGMCKSGEPLEVWLVSLGNSCCPAAANAVRARRSSWPCIGTHATMRGRVDAASPSPLINAAGVSAQSDRADADVAIVDVPRPSWRASGSRPRVRAVDMIRLGLGNRLAIFFVVGF